jgi:hypothetical protein
MNAETLESAGDLDLLKQLVEGTGNSATLYADRLAALTELNARKQRLLGIEGKKPGDVVSIDQTTPSFAVYRVRGAVACYDLAESSPDELRVVVRWCVNRFNLNLELWWEQDEYRNEPEDGGEG